MRPFNHLNAASLEEAPLVRLLNKMVHLVYSLNISSSRRWQTGQNGA